MSGEVEFDIGEIGREQLPDRPILYSSLVFSSLLHLEGYRFLDPDINYCAGFPLCQPVYKLAEVKSLRKSLALLSKLFP